DPLVVMSRRIGPPREHRANVRDVSLAPGGKSLVVSDNDPTIVFQRPRGARGGAARDHHPSSDTTSPPAMVPSALQTGNATASLTKRTDPSPRSRLTPPGCRLVAETTASPLRSSLAKLQLTWFGPEI